MVHRSFKMSVPALLVVLLGSCESIGGGVARGVFDETDRWVTEPATRAAIRELVDTVLVAVRADVDTLTMSTLARASATFDSVLGSAGDSLRHWEDSTSAWVRSSLAGALSDLTTQVVGAAGRGLQAQLFAILAESPNRLQPLTDTLSAGLARSGGAATDTLLAHLTAGLDGELSDRLSNLVDTLVRVGVRAADQEAEEGGLFENIRRLAIAGLVVTGAGVAGLILLVVERDRRKARSSLTVITQAIEEHEESGSQLKKAIGAKADQIELREWLDGFLVERGISVKSKTGSDTPPGTT